MDTPSSDASSNASSDASSICDPHVRPADATYVRTDGLTDIVVSPHRSRFLVRYAHEQTADQTVASGGSGHQTRVKQPSAAANRGPALPDGRVIHKRLESVTAAQSCDDSAAESSSSAAELGPGRTRHGTETCYTNHGCRLAECREAHRRARARRVLMQRRGVPGIVPAADLSPHIEQLRRIGWTVTQIEQTVGSRHTVRNILNGRSVLLSTASRIRDLEGPPTSGLIPAGLTIRRVQSLGALGWTQGQVRLMSGLRGQSAFRPGKRFVYESTARAVLDLYRRVGDRPGPSKRAKALAAAKGWLVPAAWDDPGTLAWPAGKAPATGDRDRTPVVDEVAVELAAASDLTGRLSPTERDQAVRDMVAKQHPDGRIAAALGCSAKTVQRIRRRLGLPSLPVGWNRPT